MGFMDFLRKKTSKTSVPEGKVYMYTECSKCGGRFYNIDSDVCPNCGKGTIIQTYECQKCGYRKDFPPFPEKCPRCGG
jgi:rubrerythrin